MAENIVIKETLDKQFAVYPIYSQLSGVSKGRSTSLLPNVITQHKTKVERYKEIFPPLSMKSLTG